MDNIFSRTETLLGQEAIEKLSHAAVAVFGLGGVGSYCVEALARCGVGKLVLCDGDSVSLTNINRQLYALHSTVGKRKTDVASERIRDINPDCQVICHAVYFGENTKDIIDFGALDYIVDAVDDADAKVLIAKIAKEYKVPMITALGAGNKLCPERLRVSDLFQTSVCPLAKSMRKRMKEAGIECLKAVWSDEPAAKTVADCDKGGKRTVGSVAFVPSAMGLILAKETILDIVKRDDQ